MATMAAGMTGTSQGQRGHSANGSGRDDGNENHRDGTVTGGTDSKDLDQTTKARAEQHEQEQWATAKDNQGVAREGEATSNNEERRTPHCHSQRGQAKHMPIPTASLSSDVAAFSYLVAAPLYNRGAFLIHQLLISSFVIS